MLITVVVSKIKAHAHANTDATISRLANVANSRVVTIEIKKIDLEAHGSSLTDVREFTPFESATSHARSLNYNPELIMIPFARFAILIIEDNEERIN